MAEMRGVGRVSKTGCEKIDGARMTDQAWKKIRGHGFHSDAPPSEDEAPYCSGKGHGHAQANC